MLYLPNNSLSVIYKTLPTEASFTTLRYLLKRYLLDKYLFKVTYNITLLLKVAFTTIHYLLEHHLQDVTR